MLPINKIKECFKYNPDTGSLLWRKRPIHHFKTKCAWASFNGEFAGRSAGHITTLGYVRVWVFGKAYFAHRLIWVMHNNVIKFSIDHIDGDKLNNNIENLRDVSQQDNMKNTKIRTTNTSGIIGVSWHKHTGKWLARASSNKTRINIGVFDSFFDACCARKSAENKHGYHENHGRR